jgi:hypothetical protein
VGVDADKLSAEKNDEIANQPVQVKEKVPWR